MKVLVFCWDIPATTNMPGSPRAFSLCRHLAERHELTLLTFSSSEERRRAFERDPTNDGVFERTIVLEDPPAPGWWSRQTHRIRREVHWSTRLRNPAYHRDVRRRLRTLLEEGRFDLLYVDGIIPVQYVLDGELPCPAIVDLHDCFTLLYRRKADVASGWIERLRTLDEARSIARWEGRLSEGFEAVVTNSGVDRAYLAELDPDARTHAIGNGVDSDFFAPGGEEPDPDSLLFTGVMAYGPNEDAAVHFVEAIFPLVRERNPRARFRVVGKDPSERLRALDGREGVTVVGEVPDMRPHFDRAGVFVCPLRWGAGVKNKVLAALAMEKPVVATPRSIDGLDLREDVDLLLAEEPEEFARKVVRLQEDRHAARELARAGRERVVRTYSWRSSAEAMERVMQRAAGLDAP